MKALILAAGLVLVVPGMAVAWTNTQGGHEPNTVYDNPTRMWQDPPQTPGKKVYFNAYMLTRTPAGVAFGVNPNHYMLESRNEAPVSEVHEAILGVWTDCNGDGYVGHAEGALREYPSHLLLQPALCPPVTSPDINNWTEGAHNFNGVVVELIPIVRQFNANDTIRYVFPQARVWGDWHAPDELPYLRSCALAPQPRGTYQSTGGAINYVDCRAGVLEAWNRAMADANDPLNLQFADEDDATTGPVGQIGTFGTEDESHSPVRVWDCEAPGFRTGNTLNQTQPGTWETLHQDPLRLGNAVHNVRAPAITSNPVGNTQDPTVPALVNHTLEGVPTNLSGLGGGTTGANCDYTDDRGEDFYGNRWTFYVGEEDFAGVNPKRKDQANWNMVPTVSNTTGARGLGFVCVNEVDRPPIQTQQVCSPKDLPYSGGAGIGSNYGVNPVTPGGARWSSTSVWLSKPGPQLVRTNAQTGMPEFAHAYWLTFYAFLGESNYTGLQLPSAAGGTYGEWHCGLNKSGIHRGWVCDPDAWYINPDGSPMPDANGFLSRPHMKYDLRDVDCFDGGNNQNIGLSTASYGAKPCP